MSTDVESQIVADSFAIPAEGSGDSEIVHLNEKKRPRPEDGDEEEASDATAVSSPKKPKLSEGGGDERPSTPVIGSSANTTKSPSALYPFVLEEETSPLKMRVLRFELKASDIVLAKRAAQENENLFTDGDKCTGWKRNDHFIFCPQEEPVEPDENAPAATSVHPLEQAWMTEHDIKQGSVWHDTKQLCPTRSVFVRLPASLVVQVCVVDEAVTLNMLVQAVERALDTPATHPALNGLIGDRFINGDDGKPAATIGHLLRDRLILVTDNLMKDDVPVRHGLVFSRPGEASRALDVSAL